MHAHPGTDRRRTIAIAIFIACATAAAFFPLYGADFLGLDDNYLITENPAVRHPSLAGIATVFSSYDPELYIPATFLSYQVDSMLAGLSPFVFHVHNLVLHLLSGLLAFLLLKRLLRNGSAALFVTLVFLLHPIQTEAVMWLSARKDLQSGFFALAALLSYVRWLDLKKTSWYAGALGLFLLALLSKVSVAVLPLLFLLIDRHEGVKLSRKDMLMRVPFWMLSIVFGIVAIAGKTAGLAKVSASFTVIIAGQSVVSTIRRLVLPLGLHPLPILHNWQTVSAAGIAAALVFALLLTLTVAALRRKHVTGIPLAAFFLLLLPSFFTFWKDGVVYLGSDRYAYLAVLPFACILAWFFGRVLHATPVWIRKTFAAPVIGFGAGACLMLTFLQAMYWQSDRSLFTRVLHIEPRSHVAHMNVGNAYRADGNSISAAAEYVQAISIKPDYAPGYRNLGALFTEAGKPQSALAYYRYALNLSPDSAEGHYGLGVAYLQLPDLVRAEREFKIAIEKSPTLMDAYIALGEVYFRTKDRVKEREAYEAALKIDPSYLPALQNVQILDGESAPH